MPEPQAGALPAGVDLAELTVASLERIRDPHAARSQHHQLRGDERHGQRPAGRGRLARHGSRDPGSPRDGFARQRAGAQHRNARRSLGRVDGRGGRTRPMPGECRSCSTRSAPVRRRFETGRSRTCSAGCVSRSCGATPASWPRSPVWMARFAAWTPSRPPHRTRLPSGVASATGGAAVASGAIDYVAGGGRLAEIHNGHPAMGRITGSGCMATAHGRSVPGRGVGSVPGRRGGDDRVRDRRRDRRGEERRAGHVPGQPARRRGRA